MSAKLNLTSKSLSDILRAYPYLAPSIAEATMNVNTLEILSGNDLLFILIDQPNLASLLGTDRLSLFEINVLLFHQPKLAGFVNFKRFTNAEIINSLLICRNILKYINMDAFNEIELNAVNVLIGAMKPHRT